MLLIIPSIILHMYFLNYLPDTNWRNQDFAELGGFRCMWVLNLVSRKGTARLMTCTTWTNHSRGIARPYKVNILRMSWSTEFCKARVWLKEWRDGKRNYFFSKTHKKNGDTVIVRRKMSMTSDLRWHIYTYFHIDNKGKAVPAQAHDFNAFSHSSSAYSRTNKSTSSQYYNLQAMGNNLQKPRS